MFERIGLVGLSPWEAVCTARTPLELLAELTDEPPGPWMLGVLDGLRDDVDTDREREMLLVCWERFIGWAHAQRAHALAGAAASQSEVEGPFGTDDFGADLVALLTGDTVASAGQELAAARSLDTELHGCRSALERGEISWRMVTEVIRATGHLQAWQRELIDQRMVSSWTLDRDLGKWRRKLRREVLRVDGDAETRRKHAVRDRHVATWPLPDGMACVHAELRAEDAATVMAALNAVADTYAAEDRAAAAAADRADDDSDPDSEDWIDPDTFNRMSQVHPQLRTVDQRRADALVDICANTLTDPDLPKRQGQRPTIQATGGLLTLLGLRNDPGELTGHGPITAEHLREIAADADWHRFLTADDTGTLISIGTQTYRPRQALRTFMTAAEPTCDFPGCGIPAPRCDAEHTLTHHHGGQTDQDNVRPRCRRHHRCKTHAGWHVERPPNGATTWTTPSGSYRIITPHRLAGDETSDDDEDSSSANS